MFNIKDFNIEIKNCSNDKKYWTAYISLKDTTNMSFNITTIPNQLIITGDAGDFIIGGLPHERVLDIFNTLTPKYDYWVSKVLSGKSTVTTIRPAKKIIFNLLDYLYTEKVQNELGEDYNYTNIDKIYDSMLKYSKDNKQYEVAYNILDSLLANHIISNIDSVYSTSEIAEEIFNIFDEYDDTNELTLFDIENIITTDEISYNFKYICDTLKDNYDTIMDKLKDYRIFEDHVDESVINSNKKHQVSQILEILYMDLYNARKERDNAKDDARACLKRYKMAKKNLENEIRTNGLQDNSKSRLRDIAHFNTNKEIWLKASERSKNAKRELNRIITAINKLYLLRDSLIINLDLKNYKAKKDYLHLSKKEMQSLRLILAEYLNEDNKDTPMERCLAACDIYNRLSSFLDRKYRFED